MNLTLGGTRVKASVIGINPEKAVDCSRRVISSREGGTKITLVRQVPLAWMVKTPERTCIFVSPWETIAGSSSPLTETNVKTPAISEWSAPSA